MGVWWGWRLHGRGHRRTSKSSERRHSEVSSGNLRYFSTNQQTVFNFIFEVNDIRIYLQKVKLGAGFQHLRV